MECSVEHSHLRNCRQNFCNRLYTKQIGRVMKRCEHRAFLKLSHHLVCNELAAYELLSAVNHAMTHSLDIFKSSKNSIFLVKESIHNGSDTYSMVLDRHFLNKFFLSGSLMLQTACFHSDPLDNTFGKEIINLFVLHIKELILER